MHPLITHHSYHITLITYSSPIILITHHSDRTPLLSRITYHIISTHHPYHTSLLSRIIVTTHHPYHTSLLSRIILAHSYHTSLLSHYYHTSLLSHITVITHHCYHTPLLSRITLITHHSYHTDTASTPPTTGLIFVQVAGFGRHPPTDTHADFTDLQSGSLSLSPLLPTHTHARMHIHTYWFKWQSDSGEPGDTSRVDLPALTHPAVRQTPSVGVVWAEGRPWPTPLGSTV